MQSRFFLFLFVFLALISNGSWGDPHIFPEPQGTDKRPRLRNGAQSSQTVNSSTSFTKNSNGSFTAPDGLIWEAVIRNADGKFYKTTQKRAKVCCNGPRNNDGHFPANCPWGAGGKHLPSKDEYSTLARQLGYSEGNPQGYDSSPIPDLKGNVFWSSSEVDNYTWWGFYGTNGVVDKYGEDDYAVRCVGH